MEAVMFIQTDVTLAIRVQNFGISILKFTYICTLQKMYWQYSCNTGSIDLS